MADKKITALTATTSVVDADVFPIVTDTTGTPTTKKVTAANLGVYLGGLAAFDVASLDDIADVTITTAANGDLLKWNGTAWVNASGYALSASPTLSGTVTMATSASIEGTGGEPVKLHGLELPATHQIRFEGTTANDFETFLTVVDPTADRTVTFQDATGTVALTSDSQNDQFVLASAVFNS
jgi:hypothetical protein